MLENQRIGFVVGRPHILGIRSALSKNGSWPNHGMASLIARAAHVALGTLNRGLYINISQEASASPEGGEVGLKFV